MEIPTFRLATKCYFGEGKAELLPLLLGELGARACVLVTDPGVSRGGWPFRLHQWAEEAGIRVSVFAEVEASPSLDTVEKVADLCREVGAEALVAVGGGSVLDAAKAAAVAARGSGDLRERCGIRDGARIPVLAFPTTAGTGAEVTDVVVLADREKRSRLVWVGPALAPDVAVVDPLLTLSCPPAVTAQAGMDALTHALEAYLSRQASSLTRPLAQEAVRLIVSHLEAACANGSDGEARRQMAAGSLLAGLAFSNTRLGLAHSLASPLCGYYDVPHGLACGILLGPTLRYSSPAAIPELARLAAAVGEKGSAPAELAERFLERVGSLAVQVGLPKSFSELGLSCPPEVAEKIAEEALANPNTRSSPRVPTKAEMLGLVRESFGG